MTTVLVINFFSVHFWCFSVSAMKKFIFLLVIFITGCKCNFDPKNHENWKLLSNDVCGQVPSLRIIGGKDAPMNAYPWIARIGYEVRTFFRTVSFRCAGVLLNADTVLTAAHCVTNLPGNCEVATVRLGEHDTLTDPDCQGDICADPVVDANPVEIIIPENYNEKPFKHDVALIKLERKLNFTNFVKPICLASGDFYRKNLTGSVAEVAGWGIYDIDLPFSSQKLQVVKLPVVENSVCTKYYPKHSEIGPTQLCIGGEIGQDSCGGDSGGPAMMVDDSSGEPRYYAIGIVSYGAKKCGKTETPGVYTKISSYLRWILDNLE